MNETIGVPGQDQWINGGLFGVCPDEAPELSQALKDLQELGPYARLPNDREIPGFPELLWRDDLFLSDWFPDRCGDPKISVATPGTRYKWVVIFGGTVAVLTSLWFIWRMKMAPIRYRSRILSFLSILFLLNGIFMVGHIGMYEATSTCWLFFFLGWVGFPGVLLCYCLRAVRLLFLYRWNMAKLKVKRSQWFSRNKEYFDEKWLGRYVAIVMTFSFIGVGYTIWTHPEYGFFSVLWDSVKCRWWHFDTEGARYIADLFDFDLGPVQLGAQILNPRGYRYVTPHIDSCDGCQFEPHVLWMMIGWNLIWIVICAGCVLAMRAINDQFYIWRELMVMCIFASTSAVFTVMSIIPGNNTVNGWFRERALVLCQMVFYAVALCTSLFMPIAMSYTRSFAKYNKDQDKDSSSFAPSEGEYLDDNEAEFQFHISTGERRVQKTSIRIVPIGARAKGMAAGAGAGAGGGGGGGGTSGSEIVLSSDPHITDEYEVVNLSPHNLFGCHIALKHFQQFAVECFSVENIQFLQAVSEYKRMEGVERITHAWRMKEDFLDIDAPMEINIDSAMRQRALAVYPASPPPHLAAAAVPSGSRRASRRASTKTAQLLNSDSAVLLDVDWSETQRAVYVLLKTNEWSRFRSTTHFRNMFRDLIDEYLEYYRGVDFNTHDSGNEEDVGDMTEDPAAEDAATQRVGVVAPATKEAWSREQGGDGNGSTSADVDSAVAEGSSSSSSSSSSTTTFASGDVIEGSRDGGGGGDSRPSPLPKQQQRKNSDEDDDDDDDDDSSDSDEITLLQVSFVDNDVSEDDVDDDDDEVIVITSDDVVYEFDMTPATSPSASKKEKKHKKKKKKLQQTKLEQTVQEEEDEGEDKQGKVVVEEREEKESKDDDDGGGSSSKNVSFSLPSPEKGSLVKGGTTSSTTTSGQKNMRKVKMKKATTTSGEVLSISNDDDDDDDDDGSDSSTSTSGSGSSSGSSSSGSGSGSSSSGSSSSSSSDSDSDSDGSGGSQYITASDGEDDDNDDDDDNGEEKKKKKTKQQKPNAGSSGSTGGEGSTGSTLDL